MDRALEAGMASAMLQRVCPYCASNKLKFLEHGDGGTLFQCELCARAAVQRWEPDAEAVPRNAAPEEIVFPSRFTRGGTAPARKPK
jgi:hypothetical protein